MLSVRLATLFLVSLLAACEDRHSTATGDTVAVRAAGDVVTTIYMNGDIITMDASIADAEALAVQGKQILAVGELEDVQRQAGAGAERVDLQGRTIIPGLIDAHGHVSYTSLNLAAANISSPPVGPAKSVDDIVRLLVEQGQKTPDAEWIVGWGYDDSLLNEQRHPTRQDLDRVSSVRPVAIRHVSGHFMSCNSKCLQLAGIDAEMEDPPGGIIRRLAGSREPDGVLEETAMTPLYDVFPLPDKEMRLALLDKAQQFYASYGVTTVQDGAAALEEVKLLREAAQGGLLYLDIVAFPYVAFLDGKLEQVKPKREYDKHFRIGGMKLVLDGSPQGKTAWLTKPYLHPPHGQAADYVGYPTLEDAQVETYVNYAFANNIPLLAHANGDAAADQMIRVVAAANEIHGNADRRSVMIHAQTAREDQIDAMLEQNIIPSYFSAHTYYWGDWHRDSVFGVERASRISPLRSSADKGLRYTTHNDTPIVPPDMMRLLWASVNRITRSGRVLGAEQRATVMEALKSVTIDAAYQYFEEDSKGSLTPGKLADLVILSHNPLQIEPMAIKQIEVLQTIKEGTVIYRK